MLSMRANGWALCGEMPYISKHVRKAKRHTSNYGARMRGMPPMDYRRCTCASRRRNWQKLSAGSLSALCLICYSNATGFKLLHSSHSPYAKDLRKGVVKLEKNESEGFASFTRWLTKDCDSSDAGAVRMVRFLIEQLKLQQYGIG